MPSPPISTRGAFTLAIALQANVATASSERRSLLAMSTRPSIVIRNSLGARRRSWSSPSVVETLARSVSGRKR